MNHFLLKSILYSFLILIVTVSCSQPEGERINITKVMNENHFVLPLLPKSVKFCGNTIELENFDVRERLDKELIVNTYYHSSTIQLLKRANRYFDELEEILKENEIPNDFKYLCLIESGLTQAVSPSGAKGFWQFMPETAKQYGLKINNEVDERLSIVKSTRAACSYIKDANKEFNDWILTAAAYNRGVGGIRRDLKDQEVTSYFDLHLNSETSRYIFRILALKIIFENQKAYGFDSTEMELYDAIKKRTIKISEPIPNLKIWAKEKGSNYRMLKLLNPWILGNSLSTENTVKIDLPK